MWVPSVQIKVQVCCHSDPNPQSKGPLLVLLIQFVLQVMKIWDFKFSSLFELTTVLRTICQKLVTGKFHLLIFCTRPKTYLSCQEPFQIACQKSNYDLIAGHFSLFLFPKIELVEFQKLYLSKSSIRWNLCFVYHRPVHLPVPYLFLLAS